jgi:hypothetical protein
MRNSAKRVSTFWVMSLLLVGGATSAWAASTEADYKTAYAAAETANNEAGKLRNQWTTTVAALKGAKKAAEGGDFDKAVDLSKQAETLAKASIFQANEQKDAWKDMEIK